MKIRILKKNKDDLNVYTVKNSNISYEELEELLNTYDKVIIPSLDWENKGVRSLPKNFGNLEVEGDLYLRLNKLTSLPKSFGNLKVGGNLQLSFNQLTSLPESFGNLKVGRDLGLGNNKLTSLPESFGNLKVGGYLNLGHNQLASLPESFGNLKIKGNLDLGNNKLTSLPESFGNLKVGSSLYLDYNKLTLLPESFGNLKIGGNLYLTYNQLTSLPESFGNLKVKGNLSLTRNQLASLPESFGNIKVGGYLNLGHNQLASLPESFGNTKAGGTLWLYGNPWIIDADFVNFCEKYKGELVLDDESEKAITTFLKRQKKLEEWEESIVDEKLSIPKYLYHATYKPFLKSIKEKGLGNTRKKMWSDSANGVVYLATNEDVAYSYAEIAEWLDDVEDYDKYVDNIVILKIDADKLDRTKLKKDSNVIDGDDTFEYHGVISFEFVEEILDKHR